LESRRLFKATLASRTALKSAGESVRTASLKGAKTLVGVEGWFCDSGGGVDVTRRRTFVSKNGWIPVPWNLLSIFLALTALSYAATNAVNHSTFWTLIMPVCMRGSISTAICFFKALKTRMSRSGVKWEEWGRRIRRRMSLLMQCAINSAVIWLSCPSYIKTWYSPFAFLHVTVLKHRFNHSTPCLLLVHSFELQQNHQSPWTLAGKHWVDRFSALKMTSGGI